MNPSGIEISYEITKISYCDAVHHHHGGYPIGPYLESVMKIELDCFSFCNGIPSFVTNGDGLLSGGKSMRLFLDPTRFKQFTGRDWDRTRKGVERHKDLEGMTFNLNLKTWQKVD